MAIRRKIPLKKEHVKPTSCARTMGQIIWTRSRRPAVWKAEYPEQRLAGFLSERKHLLPRYTFLLKDLPNNGSLPDVNTLIGIEIECEDVDCVGIAQSGSLWNWNLKSDGSLRNHGVELISAAHKPCDFAKSLCGGLTWLSQRKEPDFSWRTSVHIHLDASEMLIEDFKKMLLLYFLFEGSLFEFANPGRRDTNIFCTPLTKTNFYVLRKFLVASEDSSKEALDHLVAVIRKYSALNLAHMYDFGTVEFRHLRGSGDPKFLLAWVSLLLQLMKAAQSLPKEEIYADIARLNTTSAYDEFTEKVFGSDFLPLLSKPLHAAFLSQGVSLAKELICEPATITPPIKGSGLERFISLKYKQSKQDRLSSKVSPIAG